MRYDAFISYNHAADGELAPALQDALQHLAKPWYRRRSMTIFRDETNLSASPELFGAITDALDESRYYVLLASPGSAKSEWVGKEIAYWSSTKTAATLRLVLVLTDGALRWDKEHDCFDAAISTALHPALQHAFTADPLFIDLRDARTSMGSGSVVQGRDFRRLFRHPVAKIGARITGVDLDMLEGEDLRQHRRTLRVAWGAAAALVLLTIAAVLGLVSARSNAQEAQDQTRAAQAGELAARATGDLRTNAPLAMALSVASDRHSESSLARGALSSAAAEPITAIFGSSAGAGASVQAMAISADGHRVATNDGTNRIVIWDVATSRRVAELVDRHAMRVMSLAFDADGHRLAAAYGRERPVDPNAFDVVLGLEGRTAVWDVDRRREIDAWEDPAVVNRVTFSPDGTTVAGGDNRGNLVTWRPGAKDRASTTAGFPSVSSVTFSPDGKRLLTTSTNTLSARSRESGGVVWDVATRSEVNAFDVGSDVSTSASAFSPDGSTIAIGEPNGRIRLRSSASGEVAATYTDTSTVTQLAFSRGGGMLVSGDDNGEVTVRDTATGSTLATWSEGLAVSGVSFTADGSTLATGDDRGHVVLRDTSRLAPQTAAGGAVLDLAYAADGHDLLAAIQSSPDSGSGTTLVRWNPSDRRLVPLGVGGTGLPAAISPDGRRVAVSEPKALVGPAAGFRISVADVTSGAVVDAWDVQDWPQVLAFAPDGKALLTATDGHVERRDLVEHTSEGALSGDPQVRPQSVLPGSPGPKLALGARGVVVSVDQAEAATVWLPGKRPIRLTRGTHAVSSSTAVLAPDGRTLATIDRRNPGSAPAVHLWALDTRRRTTLGCSDGSRPTVVAFSPDGRTLAIGHTDERVTLCDIGADRELAAWSAAGAVTSLAFSTDGTQVAAGDAGGHVTRWDAAAYVSPSTKLRADVCRALRGYHPSGSEWDEAATYVAYEDVCR